MQPEQRSARTDVLVAPDVVVGVPTSASWSLRPCKQYLQKGYQPASYWCLTRNAVRAMHVPTWLSCPHLRPGACGPANGL